MKNTSIWLDPFSATYDKLVLTDDFKLGPEKENKLDLANIYNLKNLVKQENML